MPKAAFKRNIRGEWLTRHLSQEKPKSMEALTTLITRFCAGEDSWLARNNNTASNPGTSEARDNIGKPQRNKNKRRKNNDDAQDMAVNAGFPGSQSGQRKKPLQKYNSAHPAWIAYLTAHARFMVPQKRQPIIPTENAGSSIKPAGQAPKTEKGVS